jgi:4-aminobutyrate aminotransferase-like enzyme
MCTPAILHGNETASNAIRETLTASEPRALRTYTPSQAVLARSAGVYHWTAEGRRLFDFSSGVLVANLGHNPRGWMTRFVDYMGWTDTPWEEKRRDERSSSPRNLHPSPLFFSALPLNAYNAGTPLEADASRRLVELMRSKAGGRRLERVLWAASGSEAIQKALWAALSRDKSRDIILATRFGFHGKKGLAGAVSGCETDKERDPHVRFISFPMRECADVSLRGTPFDPAPYLRELHELHREFGPRLSLLITEPYLGAAGSYHPPAGYLRMLQEFCRQHDIVFVLDEVQANFGRTGSMFAYETYGIEPDIVVLGKGLGNGVPVSAAVGSSAILGSLEFGEGSDTWSANTLGCAAVAATLDEFAERDVIGAARRSSAIIEAGLVWLKELPHVAAVRGEKGGMVWGLEMRDFDRVSAADWANALVLACYRGSLPGEGGGDVGIHLLGPLANKVIRIAPPLIITEEEATESMELLCRIATRLLENRTGR